MNDFCFTQGQGMKASQAVTGHFTQVTYPPNLELFSVLQVPEAIKQNKRASNVIFLDLEQGANRGEMTWERDDR